jgi:hypothetical protein
MGIRRARPRCVDGAAVLSPREGSVRGVVHAYHWRHARAPLSFPATILEFDPGSDTWASLTVRHGLSQAVSYRSTDGIQR